MRKGEQAVARLVSEYKAKKALFADCKELGKWRRQGMPFVKQGRQFFYDLDMVHRWFGGEEFSNGGLGEGGGLLPESWRRGC